MLGSTTSASPTPGRGSTVALLAGRHVSGLRQLWCSAFRPANGGEEPFSSLLDIQARGPGAGLPLPHHPCTTYPVVSTSQCRTSGLSKSPWYRLISGVLISHLSYGNGLLMGVSTSRLCTHLSILMCEQMNLSTLHTLPSVGIIAFKNKQTNKNPKNRSLQKFPASYGIN